MELGASRGHVRLLLAVLILESLAVAVVGGHDAAALMRDDPGASAVLVVALITLLVAAVAAVLILRHLSAQRSPDWYWESDAQLVLTHSNEAVRALLGYDVETVVGRSLFELIADEDRGRLRVALDRAHSARTGWELPAMRWRHANGRIVELAGGAAPMFGAGRVVVGFRGTRGTAAVSGNSDRFIERVRHLVHRTVDQEAVDVAMQPIIDLRDGRLMGVEALARFRDGRGPDEWFSDAEQSGCGVDLELLTAEVALRAIDEVPPDGYLSINASPALVEDTRFHQLLRDTAQLDRLVVEVTEHAAVARYERLTCTLAPYRARGMRLAVDDTGAGYASFAHVLRLRPDIIKIDRSVVALTSHDAAARALVSAVVRLAAEMDAEVVAEGVELEQELHTLRILGACAVQGYLVARPTTDADEWRAWRRHRWSPPGDLALSGGGRTLR